MRKYCQCKCHCTLLSLSNFIYCIKHVTVCDHPEQVDGVGRCCLNWYFTLSLFCVTELVVFVCWLHKRFFSTLSVQWLFQWLSASFDFRRLWYNCFVVVILLGFWFVCPRCTGRYVHFSSSAKVRATLVCISNLRVMACIFAHLDCRGWWSGLFWRQISHCWLAWQLVGSI